MTDTRLIPLCGLYENVSQRSGRRYFTGYMGRAKIVMFEEKDPEPGKPTWTLYITERPEKPVNGKPPIQYLPASGTGPATTAAHRPFDDRVKDIR